MKFKHILFFLLILLIHNASFAQKYHNSNKKDFSHLAIGPEMGGLAYFAFLDGGQSKFYAEYSLGGKILIRPTERFGIHSGFNYHKAIKNYHYYSSPLLFSYTTNQEIALIGGVTFNFDAIDNKVDFNNPNLGVTIGVGKDPLYAVLTYNPEMPILQDIPLSDIRFLIGIGVRMSILIGVF